MYSTLASRRLLYVLILWTSRQSGLECFTHSSSLERTPFRLAPTITLSVGNRYTFQWVVWLSGRALASRQARPDSIRPALTSCLSCEWVPAFADSQSRGGKELVILPHYPETFYACPSTDMSPLSLIWDLLWLFGNCIKVQEVSNLLIEASITTSRLFLASSYS